MNISLIFFFINSLALIKFLNMIWTKYTRFEDERGRGGRMIGFCPTNITIEICKIVNQRRNLQVLGHV